MSRLLSLLALAALGVLAFLCINYKAPLIEADVTARTSATLADAGFGWANVGVDGRDVTLTGTAPSGELRTSAASLARDVWGVRVVNDALRIAEAVPTATEPEPEPAVEAPPPDRGAECRRRMGEAIAADEVHFAFDRADLPATAPAYLDGVAAVAADCPDLRLDLRGNTDAQGTDEYNVGLSARRVASVRRYLESAGMAADHFESEALGESEPVATNQTPAGRAANRRVDIRLIGGQQ